ncbi:hypothetical protein GGX14DRAFT_375967 [Mycena pura]|uniref:Uncharacterized protein n=1 Tax=Mycena pura TaxID=153505 RepID=A0AAD6Y4R4_9AGAR|nr:hypothetical protein GGX14DRAFT_375967 [Mycena pura]
MFIHIGTELSFSFRQVPTFGRMTIRRFHRNVSEMKKMAARDFEDILQCLLPVLEGLFPDYPWLEKLTMDVIFELAAWHADAKLRLRTTTTIARLEAATIRFGNLIRSFANKTRNIKTVETPKERQRRLDKANKKKPSVAPAATAATIETTAPQAAAPAPPAIAPAPPSSSLPKKLNLETSKLHSMGDVATAIKTVGTVDSTSTQNVC